MGAVDMDSFEGARLLRDAEVIARLQRLVDEGRRVDVRLLVQLSEVDARRLFRDAGYSSSHAYCVGALRMSADEAYFRICAARLVRRFPAVLEMYRRQELHLSAIKMLSPVLTEENHDALLAEARGKAKRDLELVIARYAPKLDVADSIRRVPARAAPATFRSTCQTFAPTQGGVTGVVSELKHAECSATQQELVGSGMRVDATSARATFELCLTRDSGGRESGASKHKPASCGEHVALAIDPGLNCYAATDDGDSRRMTPIDPGARSGDRQTARTDPGPVDRYAVTRAEREARRVLLKHMNAHASARPLSADRYHVQFTADTSLHHKLRQATELASSQTRRAGFAAVIDEALALFIAKRKRERFGVGSKAVHGTGRKRQRSRYIPRAVRGAVFAREEARCAFVSSDGQRCSERCGLEYDHRNETYGRGGDATAENLRLLCRAHNQLSAEQDYGRRLIRERIEQRRCSQGSSTSRTPETPPQPTTTDAAHKRSAASSHSSQGSSPLRPPETPPQPTTTEATHKRSAASSRSAAGSGTCRAEAQRGADSARARPPTAPHAPHAATAVAAASMRPDRLGDSLPGP